MWRWLALLVLISSSAGATPPQRVVSLGGSVTEIVYDLGQGARLVADDESSLYPEAATQLPRVGYYRSVPLEGVIAMRPDLVLASENAGPPHTLARLADLGVPLETVSDAPSLDSLYRRITQVAALLEVPAEGQELLAEVKQEVEQALSRPTESRRTLLVMNRTNQLMAAGRGTAANAILTLAGMENCLTEQQGYKPLSAEGLLALQPEMIVITRASALASGGVEQFMKRPGVAATPAARHGRIVVMDDLLILGMGPRVGQAIGQLKAAAK